MKQPLTSLLWKRLEPGRAHANPLSWKRLWHEWINFSFLASNNLAIPNDKWNPNDKWKQGCAWKGLGQFSDQGGEFGNTAYSVVRYQRQHPTKDVGKTQARFKSDWRRALYVCLIIHENRSYLLNRVFNNYRGNRIYLWFIRSLVVCG